MTGLSDLRGVFGNQGTATTGTSSANRASGTQSATSAGSAGKTGETAFRGIDQSALSLTATALSNASGNSDVRMDRVQQLQAAIANGTYNIPSSAVADKLIQSMLA